MTDASSQSVCDQRIGPAPAGSSAGGGGSDATRDDSSGRDRISTPTCRNDSRLAHTSDSRTP